jgi:hypothetical protein
VLIHWIFGLIDVSVRYTNVGPTRVRLHLDGWMGACVETVMKVVRMEELGVKGRKSSAQDENEAPHDVGPQHGRTSARMLASALLACSAIPIVAIRAVFGRARRNGLFGIWTEELRGKVERLRQCGVGDGDRNGATGGYLITVARLTKARGLWMGDGPYTIAIAAIDLS